MEKHKYMLMLFVTWSAGQSPSKVDYMVLETKATITGNKEGTRLRIYIPSVLAMDSAFPFKKGDVIKIIIEKEGEVLRIEKSK